jgi:Fe-S-cluster containining protein
MTTGSADNDHFDSPADQLDTLYRAYESWTAQFSFACRQGCTACCTRSVTMTTLEGNALVAHLRKHHLFDRFKDSLVHGDTMYVPALTTNEFAAACLAGRETDVSETVWDFTPCLFLTEGSCSIYPARPFSCRSFGSLHPCEQNGSAVVPPVFITVNSLVMQMIEHLDHEEGHWGNMIDILKTLAARQPADKTRLLRARPNPGFLVPPDEKPAVAAFLARLEAGTAGQTTCGEKG